MSNAAATAPEANEYAEYYGNYIKLVPAGDILDVMQSETSKALDVYKSISEEQSLKRYAPDKWSIKDLLRHVVDTERVFSYRALRFARADETPVEGFEQDDYVASANADAIPFADLVSEFEHLRAANLILFRTLPAEAWTRSGKASGNPVSVRALVHILAGHEMHHRNVLKERYLAS